MLRILSCLSLFLLAQAAQSSAATPVEIRWDRYAVPPIYGRTVEDVCYGLGYAQMTNHAEQLLINVAAARGRHAEYFGPGNKDECVANDIFIRTMGSEQRARQWLVQGGDTQRQYLRAFVAGANAYVADQRAQYSVSAFRIERTDSASAIVVAPGQPATYINSYSLFATYEVLGGPLKSLTFGGVVVGRSEREVNTLGTYQLPSYTRLDLRLPYKFTPALLLKLNAQNVTSEKIYTSQYGSPDLGLAYAYPSLIKGRTTYSF